MVTWMEVTNGPMDPGPSSYCPHGISNLLSADSNERDTLSPSRRNDHLVPTLGTNYLDSWRRVIKACLSVTVFIHRVFKG